MGKVSLPSFALSFFSLVFLLASLSVGFAQEDESIKAGKKLFNANCAACHKINKRSVGPALRGISTKYDREWLHNWIKNSSAMIRAGDAKAIAIWEEFNKSPMTAFPQLSEVDIDNIIAYTDYEPPAPAGAAVQVGATATESPILTRIILISLTLVFAFLVIALILIRRTLVKIAIANGVDITKQETTKASVWKAFAKNQFLVLVTVVFLLLSSAYFVYGYLMQIGVDQGYMPVQPIHFSHKIHAGDNQINCKYCHSTARVSKQSGIPSLNVCMNCHRNISEYEGEEDLEKGYTKDFYTKEIKKLHTAIGWDEERQTYTGEVQPVKWVRIHNLPDFVYFNHSQHIQVGEIDCQTCHGPVEQMEVMYQFSSLTMGWCIDCHRKTNVQMADNAYYASVHKALSKKYGVEKLTVAQMGGLECGKCHY